MYVSARKQRNLRMARYDRAEMRGARCIKTDLIHARDSGFEWRMMHEDQCWLSRRGSELPFQPINLPTIERASGLSGHGRIERDQSYRMSCDAIACGLTDAPQVGVFGKRAPQCIPVIVISGNEINGHAERGQQLSQPPVFLVTARIDQISACKHRIGYGPPPHQMLDAAREPLRSIELPVCQFPRPADVQIRYLRDDHRPCQAAGRVGAARVSAMAFRLT